MVSPVAVIAAEWTLVTLAYVFLGLRLTVRITQRQTSLIWSEVWLVLGALWLLGLVICDTLTFEAGAMSDFNTVTVHILQVRFATNYLFDAGLYFPKMSMLTIYFHIMPRHERLLRWALYCVAVFTVSSFAVTIFMDTFLCGADPSVNWSTEPGACSSFSSELLFRLNWSLCFSTEAMLFLLPMPLLRTLRTAKRKELAGLIFLFSLGIITLGVSSGRFATMITLGNDISLYIWATAEFSISQIIVSSMALRPLMKRVWRSMSSTITPKPRSRTSGGHVRFHSHSNSNPSRGQHDKDSHNGHGRSRGGSISHVFRKHAASQAQSGGGTSGSGGSTSGRGGSTLDTWQLTNISEVELQRYDHVGRENVSHTAMCWSNAGEAVGERPLDDLETGEVDPQGLRQPGGAEHKDTGSRIQQRSSISIDLV